MRVLVTGGAGFIGSHLVDRLVQEGHDVAVIDNFTTGRRANFDRSASEIELIEGDLQSYERAHHAARGREVVFHQAALPSVPRSLQDPLTSNAVNATGTLNVLLAARDCGVRRVIFASSSSVYGANPRRPSHEDHAALPISPYAVAKLAGEGYCRTAMEAYGLETIVLRYFNVFGPRQDPRSEYAAVIPRFITAVQGGARPTIYGDGEQSRDFTYVEDAVEANICAMRAAGVGGRIYNVARGEAVTLNRLVDEIRTRLRTDPEPRYTEPRKGELRHSHADVARAAADLGFTAQISLGKGLSRTAAWLEGGRGSSAREQIAI